MKTKNKYFEILKYKKSDIQHCIIIYNESQTCQSHVK